MSATTCWSDIVNLSLTLLAFLTPSQKSCFCQNSHLSNRKTHLGLRIEIKKSALTLIFLSICYFFLFFFVDIRVLLFSLCTDKIAGKRQNLVSHVIARTVHMQRAHPNRIVHLHSVAVGTAAFHMDMRKAHSRQVSRVC